jgi:hypothetical protein
MIPRSIKLAVWTMALSFVWIAGAALWIAHSVQAASASLASTLAATNRSLNGQGSTPGLLDDTSKAAKAVQDLAQATNGQLNGPEGLIPASTSTIAEFRNQVTGKDGTLTQLNARLFKDGGVADQIQASADNLQGATSHASATLTAFDQRLFSKGGLADVAEKTMLHADQLSGEAVITTQRERAHLDALLGPCVGDIDQKTPCIQHTLANIQSISGNVSRGTAMLNDALYRNLHPSLGRTILGLFWNGAKVAATRIP